MDRTGLQFPTEDDVAERAYQLFVDRFSTGRSTANCWYDAETELLDRASRAIDDAPSPGFPRRRRGARYR
jgi:hypothetical protein